jgi:hypothetical protein
MHLICFFCFQEFENMGVGEHVIPEAIGGGIILKEVCPSCNSKLNTNIDNKFCQLFLIQGRRHEYGLADKRGKKALHPYGAVVKDDTGRRVRLDENFKPIFLPDISVEVVDKKIKIKVAVDVSMEDKLEDLLFEAVKKRLMKDYGGAASSKIYEVAREIAKDAAWKSRGKYRFHDCGTLRFGHTFDANVFSLEYAKIAYEMACYCFGVGYALSHEGRMLRDAILSCDTSKIRGQLFFNEFDWLGFDSECHYVMINRGFCYIRLFELPCIVCISARPPTICDLESME